MKAPHSLYWPSASDHKVALLELVAKARRTYPDSRLGVMRGGWSSPKLLQRETAAQPLIVAAAREMGARKRARIDAWANVLSVGDAIGEHDHGQAWMTAVYCVDGEGELLVRDSEPIALSEGLLVMLDGRHVHSVAPVATPRTTIVLNVYGV